MSVTLTDQAADFLEPRRTGARPVAKLISQRDWVTQWGPMGDLVRRIWDE